MSEDEKEELGAEARFIRAMQYFGLVKRYGGVPLQTVPQEYTAGNTEALYQARDTEAATYDFIIKEIWGPNMQNDNRILRVNMANIRRKLKENPSEPKYILTELGIGYRMLEDS